MSELLGQNVSLIYYFIKEAVNLNVKGYPWAGLEMLRTAAALCYKTKGNVDLDKTKNTIQSLLNECNTTCKAQNPETLQALKEEYLNNRARGLFVEHLEALRDYMQASGYYKMMNKDWNAIIETETMPAQNQPPQKKNYNEKLASELSS